jgi:hypothetical protein
LSIKSWSDPASRPQLVLTAVLVVLAVIGFQCLLIEARAAGGLSLALGLSFALLAFLCRHRLPGEVLIVIAFGIAFVPAGGNPAGGAGVIFPLLAGLRNIALVAAPLAARPRLARSAVLASLAVVLFSFSLGKGWAILVVADLFAAAAVAWLGMGYWREFGQRLPAAAARRGPWSWAVALGLLGGFSFFVGVLVYPAEAQGLLQQFVQEKAAEKEDLGAEASAQRAADGEALGTLADAKYGAQAAAATDAGTAVAGQGPQAEPFSLVRQQPGAAGQDRILFQIKERGPGHVPVITYDQLEGVRWRPEPPDGRPQRAGEFVEGKGWVSEVKPLGFDLHGDKVGPPTAGRDQASGDAVEMSRLALELLALQMQGGGPVATPERRPLDRAKLERLLAKTPPGYGHADYLRLPLLAALGKTPGPEVELAPEVRALVASWVGDTPRGWDQIDAIVQGVRGQARYDPAATVPLGQADPLRYFLLESRRGPDYLFASAAAVLLRHQGYPSRLAGGFYIRPDDYRPLSGTTPVRAGDVHFWTQVQMPGGVWINLEPTPGYEPSRPDYSFSERVARTAEQTGTAARRYWPAALLAVILAAGLFALRGRLAERLATLWWRLRSGRPADRLLRASWLLIERRARLAGVARGQGTTPPAWSARVRAVAAGPGQLLVTLAEITDRMVHAPRTADPPGRSDIDIRTACRHAVRGCTVAALRTARARLNTPPERKPHADRTHRNGTTPAADGAVAGRGIAPGVERGPAGQGGGG